MSELFREKNGTSQGQSQKIEQEKRSGKSMRLLNLVIVLIVLIIVFALLGFGNIVSILGGVLYLIILLIIVLFLANLILGRGWYGL